MAMENFKCSMKLVHCLCLSRIFTNDRDSISFKIFGHDVSFTLEDFHIMCGLRITTHNIEKSINRESSILKRYFGKSKGVTLKDIRDFMTRNEIPKNVANHIHVCESNDDAVKLMEILVVESILFGKKTESSVMEEYASIVEDDKVCTEYPWGNVAYEKLIYSLKHALDKQNKLHSTEYKIGVFLYPLCSWFYERFPDIREKYIREDEYLDTPQVPRMLRYVCVGEPKFPELFDMFSSHEIYRSFRVLDIIPIEEELNSMPLIGQLPCSQIRSKRLTMEVQRHAEKERSTIVKEVFDKFKKEERFAIVDAVFVKVKINHFVEVNATREEVAFEGDQHVQEQVEEERSSANRLSRDGNDEAELSTENIGSKKGADNQVVETEEHTAHDVLHKVADDNATRKEAEQSSVCRHSKDGNDEELTTEKGADDQVVGTEKHALESDIAKGKLFGDGDQALVGTLELKASDVSSTIWKGDRYGGALTICKELLGGDTQEIVTTVEVETSCASIDTTQKLSNDGELNEGRVEKNLPENTPMLLDVGSQFNEAENVDIEKGMQPGKTTVEDKRQERLEAAQKEFGELMQLYEKEKIHKFTHVALQTDQISSDASQLLPNPKRKKISSSPMCDTSDIPNFNLCSFSLGSTQGTDSEGNSTAVVVREERHERREQQGVGQASATMVVGFPPVVGGVDITKSFFTELMDPDSDLVDEHIEVDIY
ncbi:uncharacterized protein [Nicotiana sylvestris]|uniref:uncharacterized protein n=1 Tax=Nicotiana sylvestris TaxID=4096 RepID=UPI00388CE7FE